MPLPNDFDTRCYDLAEYFLQDVKDHTENDTVRLADEIQSCIEGFVSNLESDLAEAKEEDEPEPDPDPDDSEQSKPDPDEEVG